MIGSVNNEGFCGKTMWERAAKSSLTPSLGAAGKKGVEFTIDGLSRVSGRAARLIYCLFHSHENMQPLFLQKNTQK